MEIIRCLIFVPGNRRDMLTKARDFDADVIIADLEDSVPSNEKENARQVVSEMTPSLGAKGQRIMVRINSLDTGLSRDELNEVVGPHLYGISAGKVESPWDVREYDRLMSQAETRAGMTAGTLKLIPWIENAKAVVRAFEIAAASPRVVGVAFGAEDFADDMEIQRTDQGDEVYFPRAYVGTAAKAAEVLALDSPYVNFRDSDGLKVDAATALKLGFKGKFAIHPSQIDIITETFSPSLEEMEYARRVLEVWREAEAAGRGSTSLDGKMVDVPIVKRAQNILALADRMSKA